jgi:SsrA-binding protein
MGKKIISTNRKAFHEYHIFDKYVAGMVLTGTEIKSIRKGAINLKDSFVRIEDSEVFLYNCHISPYEQGNRYNHEEKRVRKLLLNKREIEKLIGKIKKDGYAIVPTELFLENGWAKLEIALAKGKKLYDKREDLAKKAQSRDIDRVVKTRKF